MRYEVPRIDVMVVRDGRPIRCTTPETAAEVARQACCEPDPTVERFAVLHLDGQSQIRGVQVVAQGGATNLVLKAREVFKGAIVAGATAVVLAHNHPSGTRLPSAEDKAMTRALFEAGEVVGIPVVDHVIVTEDGRSYSFMEHGLI